MNGRKIGLLSVALLALGVVAGCGTDAAPSPGAGGSSDKPVRLAFFNPVAANATTAANQAGINAQAKAMGATVTSFDAGFDQAKQISQMQDAIASGQYDAFVVMPVNGAVLVDVTKQAIKAGIKVVADWNNIGPDIASIEPQVEGITAIVAQSMGKQGTMYGEEIVKACAGINPCTVIYMPGSFAQGSEKLRIDATKAVTDKHPNIEVKTSADGGYLAGPAQAAATDVLLAMPEIDVFFSPGDQMTVGIVEAIKKAGKLGQIKIISAGTTKQGVAMVRDGTILANIVVLPETEGRESARLAIEAVRGKTVPQVVDSSTLSPIGPIATKETLSTPAGLKFVGEYSG